MAHKVMRESNEAGGTALMHMPYTMIKRKDTKNIILH